MKTQSKIQPTFSLKGLTFIGDHAKILQDYLWSEEGKRNSEKEHFVFLEEANKKSGYILSIARRDEKKLYANTTLTFFEYCKENVKTVK